MRRRSGFTLTELLVVIAILLLLSTLAFAVFNTGRSSDRMRSGARTAQSAFLGAKDRALHAKDLRGVRLTRDQTNPDLVNGFVYLQPLPVQSTGNVNGASINNFSIIRPGLIANPPYPDAIQINISVTPSNNDALTFFNQDSAGIWPYSTVQVRIPSGNGGQWYQLARQNPAAPYWVTPDPANAANGTNNYIMMLQTSFSGGAAGNPTVGIFNGIGIPGDTKACCDILLGNDVLPFHQPITLPSGCVIDLVRSQVPVTWYAQQSAAPASVPAGGVIVGPDLNNPGNVLYRIYTSQMDVMFSPRGNVSGTIGALGPIFLCLRSMTDATLRDLNNPYISLDPGYNGQTIPVNGGTTTKLPGDTLILAVFPMTGLVQTFEADVTDVVINFGPNQGQPGSDGAADNIFNFAQRGLAAGR
jgi:prepilin-type N-terminal cleavage/methylation domain-containing protein